MSFKDEFITLLKSYGIIKAEKVEEMISYEIIYEPDTKDSHGEWMTAETIEKAAENFNTNLKDGVVKANLFHMADTESFTIVDTWIHKEFDVLVAGTNEPIKAGSWVSKIKYNDADLWELKKSGLIGGVSVGGKGYVNEETGEITNVTFDSIPDESDNGETE